MKTSVLAVGTEITVGQILNKNASWISRQLSQRGVTCSVHMTVPDEKSLMIAGLNTCAAHSEVIFVTGGLGPTSDDFTRDQVAQWAGKRLIWDEEAWLSVQERLRSRGFPVRDLQKQQCFFPEGSTILKNSQGTAHGFFLEAHNKKIFVLPGPPREVEAIWQSFINDWLHKETQNLDPLETLSWDTIGLGESEVAFQVENVVQSAFEIGYRVHLPYVEVKVCLPRSKTLSQKKLLDQIESTLAPITLVRNGHDLAQALALKMALFKNISVQDEVGADFLWGRLTPWLRPLLQEQRFKFSTIVGSGIEDLILYHQRLEENAVKIGLICHRQVREDIFTSPIHSPLMGERRRQYFTEMALAFWSRNLEAFS